MAAAVGETREILIVTPEPLADVYRRHQLVWEGVNRYVRNGPEFLYAQIDPQTFLVRSASFARAGVGKTARLPAEGHFEIVLHGIVRRRLAGPMSAERELEVPDQDLGTWATGRLERHGLAVSDLSCERLTAQYGIKRCKRTGRELRIRLCPVRVLGSYRQAQPLLAMQAFVDGIERGRRFGLGMLRVT